MPDIIVIGILAVGFAGCAAGMSSLVYRLWVLANLPEMEALDVPQG